MRFKNTSDRIEAYIKAILDRSGIVELQRSQLADTFRLFLVRLTTRSRHALRKVEATWLKVSVVAEATFV